MDSRVVDRTKKDATKEPQQRQRSQNNCQGVGRGRPELGQAKVGAGKQSLAYEAPQGRRVNAIGAYCSHGPMAGEFHFETYARLPERRTKKGNPPRKTLAERSDEVRRMLRSRHAPGPGVIRSE